MDDTQAIEQLQRGDIGGLAALVQAYQVQATRVAYLITHDLALAEDIVQAAFLRVYERIGQFERDRPFRPWFLRSVINDAIKAAQRERHVSLDRLDSDSESPLIDLLADPQPGPDDTLNQDELRREIASALRQLPPAQRAVIVQRYYLGMSEAEMAEEAACPPGTVKWRLNAARARLRALLRSL